MTMLRDEFDPPGHALQRAPVSRRGIVSWYFFDWATQPVATLITTFVIAVFFEGVVADRAGYSGAEAQSAWAWTLAAAGVVIAVFSPILGSIADAAGRRKPWVVAFSIPLIIGCLMIWSLSPASRRRSWCCSLACSSPSSAPSSPRSLPTP